MMTFEDIVDMDWLDSHSVKGEPMDLFPNDYADYNHYLAADLLSPKLEHASSPPPLLLASPPPPSSSSSMFHPATSPASCSAAAALAAATTTPPPPLTFPTTEQIKQLIELAKHQLALRAAQTNNNANNGANNNSNNNDTLASSASSTPNDKVALDSTNSVSAAAISSTVSPAASSTTSQLAAHLANTNLFVNDTNSNNSNSNGSDLPDTVSPESLMKTVIPSSSPSSKSKKLHSLASGSPSPRSSTTLAAKNSATVKLEDDSSMTPFSLSHAMDEEDDEIHAKKYTTTSRRSSLLADEVKSLEAYAESDGIDIKKLTPRERRQLRNKISARNFRVRRKEYITTLEQQVSDHKRHAETLADQLGKVEHENIQLREQVDTLKRQNLLLQQV